MAAGLGFKDFTTGEVLTAADVDGYLMQGIWVFASAAARDAAVTSPQEGNFAFLKDTNTTTYYTGSAWTNLDTTGMVNPMTTTGDTIYSSSGSTPARLGIGSTGQVLTVAGGVPSWATPSGGGANFTLLNSGGTALTAAQTITVSSIPSGTDKIMILIENASSASGSSQMGFRFNTDTGSNYYIFGFNYEIFSAYQVNAAGAMNPAARTSINLINFGATGNTKNGCAGLLLTGCNSSGLKMWQGSGSTDTSEINGGFASGQGYYNSASVISSVSFFSSSGNFDNGTMYVYTSA